MLKRDSSQRWCYAIGAGRRLSHDADRHYENELLTPSDCKASYIVVRPRLATFASLHELQICLHDTQLIAWVSS